MNCCNANGDCTQGRDCPVRKQRIKEVNDAYANGYKDAQLDEPYEDIADTFKGLLTTMTLVLCLWVVYLLIWGK
jgi:hypothetical protein